MVHTTVRLSVVRGLGLLVGMLALANCAAKDPNKTTGTSVTANKVPAFPTPDLGLLGGNNGNTGSQSGTQQPPTQPPAGPTLNPLQTRITNLYKIMLGRGVEETAWATWNATSCKAASQAIANSDEFQNKMAGSTDGVYVDTLYQGLMSRVADTAGRADFLRALNYLQTQQNPVQTQLQARRTIIKNFVDSPELANICASFGF